jgi:hypothetical protein
MRPTRKPGREDDEAPAPRRSRGSWVTSSGSPTTSAGPSERC